MLSEQAIEGFLLPDLEGTRLDARMVYTQQRVDVIHGLSAHIGKLLDLSRGVLDLVITELQSELLDARLDCIPAGQAMSDRHVAGEAEILRLENLIRRWVIEDRLGVYTGLVGECDVATGTMGKLPEVQLEGREYIYVMGFEKGTLTSTASATRFSISRSMPRLYLDLTYSGLAAYKHATRPPRGVIPTRSPMPRTAAVNNIL